MNKKKRTMDTNLILTIVTGRDNTIVQLIRVPFIYLNSLKYIIMKRLFLTTVALLSCMNLFAQSDKDAKYTAYFKADSIYTIIDNNDGNWFSFDIKTNSLFISENNMITYDSYKQMQIKVNPYSTISPDQKKPLSTKKTLQAYKKWELDYQQESETTKLKSGEEFYYRDEKPFLIWWFEIPDDKKKSTTHLLYMNFSIHGKKHVAIVIPVYADENLKEEIEKLKNMANSFRLYGFYFNMDILSDIKKSKKNYVLRDSLNLLELEVPDWLNVIGLGGDKLFFMTFPEKNEIVNAMGINWEYKSGYSSFSDFINRKKFTMEKVFNYKLIEENDSVLRFFITSEDKNYHSQIVFLKGENIYCQINFVATKDTYKYNVKRFEEVLKMIKLK